MTQNDTTPDAKDSPPALGRTADSFLKTVKHKKPQLVSVREFLGYWGYKRRGASILRVIERELTERGLTSSPELAKADYYGKITILARQDLAEDADLEAGWPISSVLDIEKELIAVGPDDPLAAVETLMVMHDFSQIPVLNKSRRELHGSVSWKSLARWTGHRAEATAKTAMDPNSQTARSSDNLLDHISRIIDNEYLYIQDPTNVYVGILTATDLAKSFLSTSGPFIKIGEVENRLRLLVNQLPLPVIQQARRPSDVNRDIAGASDLNFGEYVRILQQPDNWIQLSLPYDRTTVIRNLEEVNQIRNDVMHFRPNLDVQTTEAIDRCLNWLREIRN